MARTDRLRGTNFQLRHRERLLYGPSLVFWPNVNYGLHQFRPLEWLTLEGSKEGFLLIARLAQSDLLRRTLGSFNLLRRAYGLFQKWNARKIVTDLVIRESGWKVLSGPFAGMIWGKSGLTWNTFDLAPQLLGIYEGELHESIEEALEKNPRQVLNLGCADGYYAVGFALRCPEAEVWGIDIAQKSLQKLSENANLNRVHVRAALEVPPDTQEQALWFVDVEGAERDLLDPIQFPALRTGEIIVELHPWVAEDVEKVLCSRFSKTHRIRRIESGARNPNGFSFLREIPDNLRWSVVSEGRPASMTWLHLSAEIS